jgi:hypothetical protein
VDFRPLATAGSLTVLASAAALAITTILIVWLALRGTKPGERREILLALAVLFRALLRRK